MALPDKLCAVLVPSSTPVWDIGFSFVGSDNMVGVTPDFSAFWLASTPSAPEPDPVPPSSGG